MRKRHRLRNKHGVRKRFSSPSQKLKAVVKWTISSLGIRKGLATIRVHSAFYKLSKTNRFAKLFSGFDFFRFNDYQVSEIIRDAISDLINCHLIVYKNGFLWGTPNLQSSPCFGNFFNNKESDLLKKANTAFNKLVFV